ncbi:MAG: cell wall metabolism sensor histidine kinase WalK [Candidatus Saccharimonadales bacterium]
MQNLDTSKVNEEFAAILSEDNDIENVSLVNQQGSQVAALESNLKSSEPLDSQSLTAFKVVSFLSGKEYIGPVTYDSDNHPTVTIAVPLIKFTKAQDFQTLTTAESGIIRSSEDIKGALITRVHLQNLWTTVLAGSSTDNQSYAYVIDDRGNLIAHPNANFIAQKKDIKNTSIVSWFIKNSSNKSIDSQTETSMSETGVQVLNTYKKIPITNWAVVYEEPISSIYRNVNIVANTALLLAFIAILFTIAVSYIVSYQITKPILLLSKAAEQIGRGNFGFVSIVKRSDEIGALSKSINLMGLNLKRYVDHIESERNKIEFVINNASEGIIALDVNSHVILTNQAIEELVNMKKEMLITKKIDELFAWTRFNFPYTIDYSDDKKLFHENLQFTDAKGKVKIIDLKISKINQPDETIRSIITMHDKTKAVELESMKMDFVSLAAHELRTPLSSIRGYLELLIDDEFTEKNMPERPKNFILQARNSARQLTGLISNLLNVSRIERGALSLNMEKLDWAHIALQSVKDQQFNASEKNINLTYDGPAENVFIQADQTAISEVIDNLIANALKYTLAGGSVRVHMQINDNNILTQVIDTGIGIPEVSLPKLFIKFYRVNGGLSSGSSGTGLGLFISKSIVVRHGGQIWAESEEGRGSTFQFLLPVYNNEHLDALNPIDQTGVRRKRGWITKNIAR